MTTRISLGGFSTLAGSQSAGCGPLRSHRASSSPTCSRMPSLPWACRLRAGRLLNVPALRVRSGADQESRFAKGGVDMYTQGLRLPPLPDHEHVGRRRRDRAPGLLVPALRASMKSTPRTSRREAELAAQRRRSATIRDTRRWPSAPTPWRAPPTPARSPSAATTCCSSTTPEWTRFVQVVAAAGRMRSASPTDVLVRTGLSNVEALANGWPDIDVDDPRLPTISAHETTHAD